MNASLAALALAAAPAPPRDYAAACGACHEGNGYAVQRMTARLGQERALLSRRRDLDPQTIRVIVRRGFLAMPPMSRAEVSDPELAAIVRQLTATPQAGR